MYSGLMGKRRSASGASVDPAQSRMLLATSSKANCTGCRHCAVLSGPRSVDRLHETCESYVCMADDPPRAIGQWLAIRPDWCPIADRVSDPEEGLEGGQGRGPADVVASTSALKVCLAVGLALLACWVLAGCRHDLPIPI